MTTKKQKAFDQMTPEDQNEADERFNRLSREHDSLIGGLAVGLVFVTAAGFALVGSDFWLLVFCVVFAALCILFGYVIRIRA